MTSLSDLRVNKSFVRREGRITKGQQQALARYWSLYGLEVDSGRLDLEKVFSRQADCVLEIGFGMGKSLLTQAQQQPEKNFIGIEVYRPGVGALLAAMVKQQVNNIRIYSDDAITVLNQCIIDHCLSAVQIYFPDPWHKKRHHKRRLIQIDFLILLRKKLKLGGVLHLATDWQDYADQMLKMLTLTEGFNNKIAIGGFAPRPSTRPLTKFEQRGENLGHNVFDLLFTTV